MILCVSVCVCACTRLCYCARAHKWKTRVTAKNAKGNPRRQKGNKENGKEIIENSISGDGEKWKQLKSFQLGETEEEVNNGSWEIENKCYSEEHYQPCSFYTLWMATTLLEINLAIMTLAYKILISFFPIPKIVCSLSHKCTCKGSFLESFSWFRWTPYNQKQTEDRQKPNLEEQHYLI